MKLVEIKNSLAKLYYEPLDFPLVISDFLTIDDGNQKILSQVVSIESTTKEDTNCAILKFTLDLDDANKQSTYSGYVPALDAIVSKTKPYILNEIFCSNPKSIKAGYLTNSSKLELKINADILNKFLYIQADRQDEIDLILKKITDYNGTEEKKTLIIQYNDIEEYENANVITLGKELKLPVNNDILNYIYENDLTGLTVEQKAIVQDILLEIQEYINTLEDGYIPFNTLLDVVNEVYESDKSTGVILLRNKLLKYQQLGIFASTLEEINALYDSLKNNTITLLDLSQTDLNWQKETTMFALQNIDEPFYVITEIDDNITDEKILNELYKNEYIRPIVASDYESINAAKAKSFAKNLILFKPDKQQKAAASYNSFLMKLAPLEYIVSGETTYYTPLIVQKLPEQLVSTEEQTSIEEENIIQEISVTDEDNEQPELAELISNDDEFSELEEYGEDINPLEDDIETNIDQEESEIKTIFDESVEQEIAQDVDKMFTAESNTEELPDVELDALTDYSEEDINNPEEFEDAEEQLPVIDEEQELISDNDLDILEQLSDSDDSLDDNEEESYEPEEQGETGIITAQEQPSSSIPDLINDDDETLDELEPLEDIEDSEAGILGNSDSIALDLPSQESIQESILDNLTENDSIPSVPIYQPEYTAKSKDGFNITEGNIVYHEKYGKGVVEELFNYGKRTLCSIQFDNVGRRLLDPNLAELKQM